MSGDDHFIRPDNDDLAPEEDREFLDVRRLYRRFGFLENATPTPLTDAEVDARVVMMREELDEFVVAALGRNLPAMADALVDLVVFAKGTASMMGLPWRALWDDVQRANLAKVRGPTKRGLPDDIAKPPGWVGPQTAAILIRHGWKPTFPGDAE
jgi:predicted HAD superfamily Cof-like phosphohydrolase